MRWWWLGLSLALPAMGQDYSCTFVDPPRHVVEGQELVVRLRYRVPEGRRVMLRCELKSTGHIVLRQEHAEVAGEGVQEFSFTAPSRAAEAELLVAGWMGDDWRQSLCPIVHTPGIEVVSAAQARRLTEMAAEAAGIRARLAAARSARGGVVVAAAAGADWPADLAEDLARRFAALGYGVTQLTPRELATPDVLKPDVVDLLVLSDARALPVDALRGIAEYEQAGGNLVVLGGPAFETLLWPLGDQWLPESRYRAAVAESVRSTVQLDFEATEIGTWTRATNHEAAGSTARRDEGARGSTGGLLLDIRGLSGWDTFTAPVTPRFPEGHTWTTFWAKGDAQTSQLSIEWREEDGSRWIATVGLTEEWQPYALPPQAFAYWRDSPTGQNRGGAGDGFHPERAASLTFGLAFTHTTAVGHGDHRIWIDDVGSAPEPEGVDSRLLFGQDVSVPWIEGVSPHYKTYPVTNLARIAAHPGQTLAPVSELPAPGSTRAICPRPQGTGYGKARRWRFQPLLDALDADGRNVGAVAALVIDGAAREKGGVSLSMPVTDPAFFAAPTVREWIVATADRVLAGTFLYEGGAAYYASFGGETMPIGAVVSHRGTAPTEVTVRATVTSDGNERWRHEWVLTVPAGGVAQAEEAWALPADAPGPFTVTVELRRGEAVIDRLQHEVLVWRPNPNPTFLRAREGQFFLGDQPWYAHGVNYMPSSGIGIEDGPYFEYWLDPQPYDPEVIERDLDDCVAIGFNTVSVFCYYRSLGSRNLLDLLCRCRAHGLKVNLSLRPGTGIDFRWDEMRALVETYRLAQNDDVIAYDLAWEPHWGGQAQRRGLDGRWADWVLARYGSLAAAEQAWGVEAPRFEGKLTNPPDAQLAADGPWRKLVADYRAWQRDILHTSYHRARELMRSVDPNHLVSFRMSIAGDPTLPPGVEGYDFADLKDAVDILEPEGYGRIGDWERVKGGWFTVAYARAVAPALPVLWAEFGNTVWDATRRAPNPDRLAFTARFYDDFYQMAYRSGANGTICWWFPGGYRWNERSDFGILNPDRSWREVTRVIHDWAPRMTAPRPLPTPDVTIEVERGLDGLYGIYQRAKEAFWKAVDDGRTPALVIRE